MHASQNSLGCPGAIAQGLNPYNTQRLRYRLLLLAIVFNNTQRASLLTSMLRLSSDLACALAPNRRGVPHAPLEHRVVYLMDLISSALISSV